MLNITFTSVKPQKKETIKRNNQTNPLGFSTWGPGPNVPTKSLMFLRHKAPFTHTHAQIAQFPSCRIHTYTHTCVCARVRVCAALFLLVMQSETQKPEKTFISQVWHLRRERKVCVSEQWVGGSPSARVGFLLAGRREWTIQTTATERLRQHDGGRELTYGYNKQTGNLFSCGIIIYGVTEALRNKFRSNIYGFFTRCASGATSNIWNVQDEFWTRFLHKLSYRLISLQRLGAVTSYVSFWFVRPKSS